jgi:hypothetical protein
MRCQADDAGYAALWSEQVGDTWRENGPAHTWPASREGTIRWELRSCIDAVVAHCYGFDDNQYGRVLQSFKHWSFPDVPQYCFERFHELRTLGIERFARRHDPYWDIPLNESLPKPVIDLPGVGEASDDGKFSLSASPATPMRSRRRKT